MKNHKIGFYFPLPVVIIGAIISFIGVVSIIQVTVIGLFLLPIGLFFLLSEFGSQMDTENRLVREYVGFFGYKKGSWKDLDDFPYITVLKSRSGITFFSQSNRSTSLIEDDFEVYLLTKNHRLKVLIQKFETKEVALMHSKNFSTLIKSEIVVYNPVVSEKTRLRRNSR